MLIIWPFFNMERSKELKCDILCFHFNHKMIMRAQFLVSPTLIQFLFFFGRTEEKQLGLFFILQPRWVVFQKKLYWHAPSCFCALSVLPTTCVCRSTFWIALFLLADKKPHGRAHVFVICKTCFGTLWQCNWHCIIWTTVRCSCLKT